MGDNDDDVWNGGSPSVSSRFSSPSLKQSSRGPLPPTSPVSLEEAKDLIAELTDRLELANSDRWHQNKSLSNVRIFIIKIYSHFRPRVQPSSISVHLFHPSCWHDGSARRQELHALVQWHKSMAAEQPAEPNSKKLEEMARLSNLAMSKAFPLPSFPSLSSCPVATGG